MSDVAEKNRGYVCGSITKFYKNSNKFETLSGEEKDSLKLKIEDYFK